MLRLTACLLLAGVATSIGCSDPKKSVSNSEYYFEVQHEMWGRARAELAKPQPNLDIFRTVWRFVGGRTLRRFEKDYDGPNRQEIIDLMTNLKDGYESGIVERLDLVSSVVGLKAGATGAEIRAAFEELDAKYYRRIEELTAE